MRIKLIAIIALSSLSVSLSAQPSVSPYMAVTGGVAVTAETDYNTFMYTPVAGAAASVQAGLIIGDSLWAAMVQGGQSFQAATDFTDDGYRYRGFYSLNLAMGPRLQFKFLDAYLLGGGMLARYDLSFSYFFFPYLEPGFSMPVLALGEHFSINLGLSLPIYLRADSFSAGLRVVATVAFKENQESLSWSGKKE